MKIGPRIPSLRKRLAARTSLSRYVRHSLGLKAPRGWGWITNPKKAAYNRVYNRTTWGCLLPVLLGLLLVTLLAGWGLGANAETPPPRDAKVYDRSGRYQGRVTSDGHGQAKTYDKSGHYRGKAVRQGKSIKIYDKSGRYIGRINAR